jgi:hypothetical protein
MLICITHTQIKDFGYSGDRKNSHIPIYPSDELLSPLNTTSINMKRRFSPYPIANSEYSYGRNAWG